MAYFLVVVRWWNNTSNHISSIYYLYIMCISYWMWFVNDYMFGILCIFGVFLICMGVYVIVLSYVSLDIQWCTYEQKKYIQNHCIAILLEVSIRFNLLVYEEKRILFARNIPTISCNSNILTITPCFI